MNIAVGKLKFDAQLLDIRPIDAHVVSRYRQYMRNGSKFPDIVVAAASHNTIVIGNHVATAVLEEYGKNHVVTVTVVPFASRAAILRAVAESNVAHGLPMSGITRTKLRDAMLAAGLSYADIATSMQTTEWHVQNWGSLPVIGLLNRKATAVDMPIKECGISPSVRAATAQQYADHIQKDVSVPPELLAKQLTRWLRAGWVDLTATNVRAALHALRVELNRRRV